MLQQQPKELTRGRFYLPLVVLLLFQFNWLNCKRIVVNKIVARVNGVNILKSDLEINHLYSDQTKRFTLDDAIDTVLMLEEANKRKMLPTELEVERHIGQMRPSGMSDEEFEQELKKGGYTLKRYKSELSTTIAVNRLTSAVISEKVFVSAQDVERYVEKHPEYTEEKFLLKTCIVPDVKKIKKEDLDWAESDWISASDISEKISFVFDMKKGQVSEPLEVEQGFQLVELVDKEEKRLKTLKERFSSVEHLLREEQLKTFEGEFKQELRKTASITKF